MTWNLPRVGAALAFAPCLTFAFALLTPGAGVAQDKGTPPTYTQLVKEGAALAEKLCSSCHLMEGLNGASINASVPPFKTIANVPGQTAERLRNVMINPHSGMPDVRLSNPEIERLTAYIDSLRGDAAGPPLTSRKNPGVKPQYPNPS